MKYLYKDYDRDNKIKRVVNNNDKIYNREER